MPMYYPDLESVKRDAEMMSEHKKESERYKGIIPQNDKELPLARKQLGQYFRTVWKDEIQAMEIELALTEENYEDKMREAVMDKILFNK